MSIKSKFISITALGLLALSSASCKEEQKAADTTIAPQEEMSKCYGIAKKGKNECASASGKHGCDGEATTDDDPCEWVLAKKDECASKGGTTEPVNCKK